MIKFNTSLSAILLGAVSKQDWTNRIITALGDTRRVRCKRSNDASDTDVWTNGVEFINCALTGTIASAAGNIASFGNTSNLSVHTAANLTTGSSVLRIEGNGNWIEGTLGLDGSNCDFTLSANPTNSTGIAFGKKSGLLAPRFLPSGTGPAAPTLTADAPAYVEIMDYSNPQAPTIAGTILFNNRIDDLVMQDSEKAADMGDVMVVQSTQSVVLNGFEFGAMLLAMSPEVNTEANTPVYQVLVNFRPYGRWSGYPSAAGLNLETDVTHMSPFKVNVKTTLGDLLGVLEMHDGLPINSPLLSQVRTTFEPLRPHLNCGNMLFWEKGTPRDAFKLKKYFPGVTADALRPSQARFGDSVNGFHPLLSTSGQTNSFAHFWAMPKWPMGHYQQDPKYTNLTQVQLNAMSDAQDGESIDNYSAFQISSYYSGGGATAQGARAIGWGYEPGSISGHDWFNGPGGHRFDRSYCPSILALYITDKNGVRIKGNYSFAEINKAWRSAYFNHSHHHFTDVKSFQTIPMDQVLRYEWSHSSFYYGTTSTVYVPGGDARHIPLWSIPQSSPERFQRTYTSVSTIDTAPGQKTITIPTGKKIVAGNPITVLNKADTRYGVIGTVDSYDADTGVLKFTVISWTPAYDVPADGHSVARLETYTTGLSIGLPRNPDGHMMWNGWAPDSMHNYCLPGWYTLLTNSPAHLVSARHRFIHHVLCQIADHADPRGIFLMRAQAWRWGQWVMAWKIAANHPLGISREEVEAAFEEDMMNVYNYRYLAAKDPANPDYNKPYNQAIRNLGVGVKDDTSPTRFNTTDAQGNPIQLEYHECITISQTYYFSHVFYLLKQSGCWKAMAKRNPKCDIVMRFMLECLDKFAIDFILDTDGRIEGYYNFPGEVGDHYFPITKPVASGQPQVVPANWAEWNATVAPKVGQETWVRDESGTLFQSYERSATMHFRAQWAFMRRDCFPEIPYPRLDAACAKYQAYYDERKNYALSYQTPNTQTQHDWHYRIPSSGIIQPPSEVEPLQ